jgi:tetratricopeptide (TPR) repeat protein
LALATGALILVGILATGALGIGIVDRLLNLESLGWRSAMWTSLVEAWVAHPLAGLGPGSFPWVLQLTDYFQTNSWAPRHPDSAVFQLVAEAGILGIAALVTLAATLVVRVLRSRSTAAAWALATFAVAGVGSNPTDFPFMCIVAVAWVAYAVPRDDVGPSNAQPRWRPVRIAHLVGLLVIAVAYSMTTAAAFFYEDAREAVARGDLAAARPGLEAAVTLDPGLALYARQRGTLSYAEGNASAGIRDLELAVQLNPSDDLAWRTLALAFASAGDGMAAEGALARALETQRSDPTNLLLSAYWQGQEGKPTGALARLGEVVRAWPATVAGTGWEHIVPASLSTSQVVDEAVRRWVQGDPSPESFSGQGIWLAILGNRPDLLDVAIDELGVSAPLANATVAVLTCDPASGTLLDEVPNSDRRTQLYWHLRVRHATQSGSPDDDAIRIIGIMSGAPLNPAAPAETLNPLHQNGWIGFSADAWGYRRLPIVWPADDIQLPSPEAGVLRWLLDPDGAIRAAGLEDRLPDCV